jgi:glycosyltransferase involved in cell wall biosynthesis
VRLAFIGTRGVPAKYGGFETAVEEISVRLAARGHQVVVYCRGGPGHGSYRGVETVTLPARRSRSFETLVHTGASMRHVRARDLDVIFLFNAANSPAILLRRRGVRVACHPDGLEWARGKWGPVGSAYYRIAEVIAVLLADELISDAAAIRNYYRHRYAAHSEVISYGADPHRADPSVAPTRIPEARDPYCLVVARSEPENNVALAMEALHRSTVERRLLVVGSSPYPGPYQRHLEALAAADSRIHLLGSIWDQDVLDSLYAASDLYVHGHSVGGTNPSLLRAMAVGAAVAAFDTPFNREVLGEGSPYWRSSDELRRVLEKEDYVGRAGAAQRAANVARIVKAYNWDDVAVRYEQLALELVAGGRPRRTRRKAVLGGLTRYTEDMLLDHRPSPPRLGRVKWRRLPTW